MNYKPNPNHRQYLLTLTKMGAEQRLIKALELSSITKTLFLTGLHKRFPDMLDNAPANNLPEWIAKLSDEEKQDLIVQIADSIQSPAPASGPQKASPKKPRKKRVPEVKLIPEHIQKYIRPRP